MTTRVLFGSNGWPCGMHEVASYAVREGLAEAVVHALDGEPLGERFESRLRGFRPDIVGFRIEAGGFDKVCAQIREVRNILDSTIILGGPTATLHPVEVLEQTGADYVFAGDAEKTFADFLRLPKPCSPGDLAAIPGLAFRPNDRATIRFLPDDRGSEAPYPRVDGETLRANRLDWSLLEGFLETLDSLYLTGGRGCPGRCTFCSRLHGREVRTKSAGQIVEEILGADRLVREGRLRLGEWTLYENTDSPTLRNHPVRWCSIFDEDFFLDRDRAAEFLQCFEFYGLQRRYRLSFQTNPRSLLDSDGTPDARLFYWIARVKAMIQLGAESFHPDQLTRWKKRHSNEQLELVLKALDATGQDYNVFLILTDYQTSSVELRESAERLLDAARRHPRMRIASTPYMIPLYGTPMQRELERTGLCRLEHFTEFETPHPDWLDVDVADRADRIDEALQAALHPEHRDAALERVRAILDSWTP